MMIDHEREFKEIQNSLEQTKIKMNYYKVWAWTDNLTSVLLTNPRVLHFSGHGVKNNIEEIGTEVALRKNQGDLLVFENKTGWAELVSEMMLKELLKQWKTEIDLVFVSSCHSEFIGDIFFKAGINHVIWIKESKTISDEASIIFAKAFYQALFSLNSYSIWEAFEAAKGAVKLQGGISCNTGEHHKYILKWRYYFSIFFHLF